MERSVRLVYFKARGGGPRDVGGKYYTEERYETSSPSHALLDEVERMRAERRLPGLAAGHSVDYHVLVGDEVPHLLLAPSVVSREVEAAPFVDDFARLARLLVTLADESREVSTTIEAAKAAATCAQTSMNAEARQKMLLLAERASGDDVTRAVARLREVCPNYLKAVEAVAQGYEKGGLDTVKAAVAMRFASEDEREILATVEEWLDGDRAVEDAGGGSS